MEYRNEKDKTTEPQVDLFFLLNFGNIYESLGYYLMALKYYMRAKTVCEKMDKTNPDHALVYCSLGNLFVF